MRTLANAVYSQGSTATNIIALKYKPVRKLIDEPRLGWWPQVVSQLEELVRLESGWDGYRGIPVSLGNAIFAVKMLEVICGADTPVPQIVPGSQGALQIEWHTINADIELHVLGPNSVQAWRATAATGPEGETLHLTNDFLNVVAWVGEIAEREIAPTAAAA